MATESPRWGELAELVADHLLGDEHGHVLPAVVDRDRVPDHLREDRRRARPGLDHLLRVGGVHGLDPRHEALLDPRPLLAGTRHLALALSTTATTHDVAIRRLVLLTGAVAEGR